MASSCECTKAQDRFCSGSWVFGTCRYIFVFRLKQNAPTVAFCQQPPNDVHNNRALQLAPMLFLGSIMLNSPLWARLSLTGAVRLCSSMPQIGLALREIKEILISASRTSLSVVIPASMKWRDSRRRFAASVYSSIATEGAPKLSSSTTVPRTERARSSGEPRPRTTGSA